MFSRIAVLVAAGALAGPSSIGSPIDDGGIQAVGAEEGASFRVAQDVGKMVYEGKGNCAACHGKDGKGTPLGPDLTDGEWLHTDGTLKGIADVVRSGVLTPKKYPAPMPPMGGARLRDAEIEAVARYVFSLGPQEPARR